MGYPEAQYTIDSIQQDIKDNSPSGLPCCDLTCSVVSGNYSIQIYLEVRDTVVENQVLARFKSMDIICKEDSAPESPDDGVLMTTITRDTMRAYKSIPFEYKNVEADKNYVVRLFPKSDHDVVSYNRAFIYHIRVANVQVFGFHQDFTQADPDSQITYIGLNENFKPMMTNVDNGEWTMGSWDSWGWLNKVRPFMLNNDGSIDYALDPNDYSKKLDGSPSDMVEPSDTFKQVHAGGFVWIPRLYIKDTYDADKNGRTVLFTDSDEYAAVNNFVDYVFVRPADVTSNEFDISIHQKGVYISMCYPSFNQGANTNITDGMSIITKTGLKTFNTTTGYGWNTYDGVPHENLWRSNIRNNTILKCFGNNLSRLLRDVVYMLYKTTHIQTVSGYTIGNWTSYVEYPLTHGGFFGYSGTNNAAGHSRAGKMFHSFVLGSDYKYVIQGMEYRHGTEYVNEFGKIRFVAFPFKIKNNYISGMFAGTGNEFRFPTRMIKLEDSSFTNESQKEYAKYVYSVWDASSTGGSSSTYSCGCAGYKHKNQQESLISWGCRNHTGVIDSKVTQLYSYRGDTESSSCAVIYPQDPNFTPYDEEVAT